MKIARLIFGALMSLALAAVAQARDIVIHAGRVIDGTGAAARSNVSIRIHDDRIVAIEPGFTTPAGAEVIDLSGKTVLPGLIDCHVHITAGWHPGDPIRNAVTRSEFDDAIEAPLCSPASPRYATRARTPP